MERIVGTVVRGLRAPIFKEGDDLSIVVPDLIMNFYDQEHVQVGEKDVLAITESVVARTQGNYVDIATVGEDITAKMPAQTIGVIFPILSRNRFAIVLKAIAMSAAEKIVLMLSYPSDEVGNHLLSYDQLDDKKVNPYSDVLTEDRYRVLFGYEKHAFTGIDYVSYYREIIESVGKKLEIIFANRPEVILDYTSSVITCDIHTRKRTKRILLEKGAKQVLGLDDIMTEPIHGSGYNAQFGLLGSNKATEEKIKLFPRDSQALVEKIQQAMFERTGKMIEVMIYGDGAFKDPVGKIWELADPVVSPGYTAGLEGTPNEIKLKYIADNQLKDLQGEELKQAIKKYIHDKDENLMGQMITQGTTPRQLTDLLGSLCDLTSGSGDKGTPIIYIQGYFDNYTK